MQSLLILTVVVSFLVVVVYFFIGWLSEKRSKPFPDSIMTLLRFILFTSAGLMLLLALSLV